MSTTPTTLPPLTPGLIEAAKNYHGSQVNAGAVIRYGWKTGQTTDQAAIHILTRALSAHRGIPMGGTKVGDLVKPCHDRTPPMGAIVGGDYKVTELCPFRGVRIGLYVWYRSWVRVKGGAA